MTEHRADNPRTGAGSPVEALLEEIDNPIERLKLLSEDDEGMARYLDALEISSPRERELVREIARTRPLALPERFGADHRLMVEALESLARHGYQGSQAGKRFGPLAPAATWFVTLMARYLVVSHIKTLAKAMRNLYGLREIQSLPDTPERAALNIARTDAERMVAVLDQREIGLPTFVIGGAILPLVASVGRITGTLSSTYWASAIGVAGMLLALCFSWALMRGAAIASRRIRLATNVPAARLWESIGWCGRPPRSQIRTFVIAAVGLTIASWIVVPVLVGIALAT
ncbi:MAG: hypothetical protein ACRC50_12655 [Gaiella sp.]